jgi:DNA mismatch repair protein MutS
MEVLDRGGEIVFLKRVREGPSSNSYGIHVARLAGLPAETLAYAEKMLAELNAGAGIVAASPPPLEKPSVAQAQLFSSEELVLQEILALHPDKTTPLDALTAIARWKKELSRNGDD